MGFKYLICCYVYFTLVIESPAHAGNCNVFQGSWVFDKTYPLYAPSSCPLIRKEFNCVKNGRPDSLYLKYRWQPTYCNIPRFDGKAFLKKFRGKKIMFVGDSLSSNFYTSLVCLLHAAVPKSNIRTDFRPSITTTSFQDYGVQVMVFHSLFLVDIEKEKIGRVLKLQSLKYGKIWRKMDVLVFNTWAWWANRKQFDYIQDDNQIFKEMKPLNAYRKALTTWAKWVNSNIDSRKTKVFFQGISPSHYKGRDWNHPGLTNCARETNPLYGSTYPNTLGVAPTIVKNVLSTITKPVELLDFQTLSGLRKDGHPSKYNGGMDCLHWCVPGVPDTWSQLLYALLIRK